MSHLIKYLLVGVLTNSLDFAILYLLVDYGKVNYIFASNFSFIATAALAYILHRIYTFKSKDTHVLKQFAEYITVTLIGLVLNMSIMYLCVETLNIWYITAKAIALVAYILFSFIANKYITFNATANN